jgi:predicted outer membrane protein
MAGASIAFIVAAGFAQAQQLPTPNVAAAKFWSYAGNWVMTE